MTFKSKESTGGSGFKFGANNVALEVTFVSPSKDGSSPKQILINIPDTFNRKIIWVPKQEGKELPMPFNKYTFENGAELKKGQMMSPAQSNEFELDNFLKQIGTLEEAFGITEKTEGNTLTEYIENFCKAANGRKAWIKMVYQEEPNATKGKYYLEISKERKGWISNVAADVVPTQVEIEHAAKAEAYNTGEPTTELTSAPKPSDDLPF
jgi:hypothetical protein